MQRMLYLFTACAVLAAAPMANTQNQPTSRPMTPSQTLKAIQQENEAILKRQQALLERVDSLEKEASQLRIFTRRS